MGNNGLDSEKNAEKVTFDYVIVGAGSAGCVLAARLSEDADVRVAVIEAGGGDTAQEIHIPAAFPQLFKSRFDWDYQTEPEPGLDLRSKYLPRGKVLGGSSSMNAMIYMRGNRADYDGWAAGGAKGWSYDEVLPYFKKAEDNERGASEFHGVGGPLSVSDSRSMHGLMDSFVEAAKQAGYEGNDDFNGARQEGFGRFQLTQRRGMRCSAAVAYLHPAMTRANLKVITDATCTRIVFEKKRAVGVEVSVNGNLQTIRAEREVIVSAGSYASPRLLMLSGVGPANELPLFQIEVIQDLPVGFGLQDHPAVVITYYTDRETLFTALCPENASLLEKEGRGALTSNVGESGGFVRTQSSFDAPDIQFHGAPAMFYDEGLGPVLDHAFALGPCVLKPTSRGRVMLRSMVADAKPRIINNYLTTDEDKKSMIAGMKIGLEIANQKALKCVQRSPHKAPASDSDKDIWDFVQHNTFTIYHPTSTCAMGSVVDHELRVYGLEGLRVVDASVMPSVTRGNTNAPTIMIAERIADIIRGIKPQAAERKQEVAQA
jgi:choline dehydrogenase-like flavoprotein